MTPSPEKQDDTLSSTLNRLRRVRRLAVRAPSTDYLLERLPSTLLEDPETEFAWVGTLSPETESITVFEATDERPRPTTVELQERATSSTYQALAENDILFHAAASTTTEYRDFGLEETIREDSTSVTISLSFRDPSIDSTVEKFDGGNTDESGTETQNSDLTGPQSRRLVGQLYSPLEDTGAQTVELFSTFQRLLTERLQSLVLFEELQRERRRLEQLRSAVSHDLATPVNVAMSRVELATDECESAHLSHALDALDQVTKLATRESKYVTVGRPLERFDVLRVDDVARDCWEALFSQENAPVFEEFPSERTSNDAETSETVSEDSADEDSKPSTGTLDTTPVAVCAEPERLEILLDELLENVLVHGPQSVEVEVGPLPDSGGFFVEDTGPGIPSDDQPFVFDRGFTTDPERDGTGLSLALEAAQAHGWSLRYAPGQQGARFEVYTGYTGGRTS